MKKPIKITKKEKPERNQSRRITSIKLCHKKVGQKHNEIQTKQQQRSRKITKYILRKYQNTMFWWLHLNKSKNR